MKSITLDMTEYSVLLVGKVIGRVKKGVFGVALLSHVTDNKFNKMILFDVRGFIVEKETNLRKIYDSSHPRPDIIQEDASLDRIDQVVTYSLDYLINNNSDFEDMEKTESSSESEKEDEDEQDHPQVIEKKVDKNSNNLDFYAWDRHEKKHNHYVFQDDDIMTTPYSIARSKPSMNNINATEWNTISDSHVLSKSMPEVELGKWITWTNIK